MTMRKGLRTLVAAIVAGCCFADAAANSQAQMPPGYGEYNNDEVVQGQVEGYPVDGYSQGYGDGGGTAFGIPDGNVYSGYGEPASYGSCCGQGCGPGCGPRAPMGGCDDCCTPCCKGGWSAGGSAYVLAPYAANNTAFLATNASTSTPSNITWNYSASPAIWIGHRTAGGLKTRGRFFYFDQFSNTTTATASGTSTLSLAVGGGIPTTTVAAGGLVGAAAGTSAGVAQNRLFINAVDLETGVYEAAAGRYSFQFYAGLRYMYISSTTFAALANIGTDTGLTVQSANYYHGFTGGGPTIFGQGYRQIGGSNFALFGNARGALLVGNTHRTTSDTVLAIPVGRAIPSAPLNYNNNQNGVLPVMEMEAGLEYRHPWHRKLVFARVALVDMTFFNFGGPLDTASNLSLLGGRASIGCNY